MPQMNPSCWLLFMATSSIMAISMVVFMFKDMMMSTNFNNKLMIKEKKIKW